MPYQSNSRLADLILQQGQIAADRAQRKGDVWAGVVRGVASLPDRIGARKAAEQDAAMQRRQQEAAFDNAALQRQVLQGNLTDQARDRQREDEALAREEEARTLAAKTQKVHEGLIGLSQLPDVAQQQVGYQQWRNQMVQDGTLTERDAPQFYPGRGWIKSKLLVTGFNLDRMKALLPDPEAPKTREIKVRNADGSDSIQIVQDTPGQSFISAAPRPTEFEWVTRGGRPVQIAKGTATAGDRPYQPPSQAAPNYSWQELPDGTPAFLTPEETRRLRARPLQQNRVPTEAERRAAGFHGQMQQAITNIDALENQLTEQDIYQFGLPQEGLFGAFNRNQLSDAGKRYLQALEAFTEARLRPVSGAAISASEYERDRRTYARQFNETPELAGQRRQSRQLAFDTLKSMAGRAETAPPQGGAGGGGEFDFDPATGQLVPRR